MQIGLPKFLKLLPILLLTVAGSAHASLDWEWSLLDWTPTVGQTDSIVLQATLYNSASSTENITAASFLNAAVDSNEGFPYTFAFPDGGLLQQFASLNLNPGESFEFTFGTYTPIGTVDPGQYFSGGFTIDLQDAAGVTRSWTPDQNFLVTVEENSGPVASVPEPSSVTLLLAGLGGIMLTRRRQSGAVAGDQLVCA